MWVDLAHHDDHRVQKLVCDLMPIAQLPSGDPETEAAVITFKQLVVDQDMNTAMNAVAALGRLGALDAAFVREVAPTCKPMISRPLQSELQK